MKSTLPASHLLKQFVLFLLTTVFLLTVTRAAYGLWQFVKVEEAGAVLPLFVQGLRYDIALVGLVCLLPVMLGSFLAMTNLTRGIAKFIVVFFLITSLLLILTLELITPWFIQTQGLRPDISLLASVESPIGALQSAISLHAIPLAIGVVLCLLILFAFWSRLELQRFLRYRLSVPSAVLLALGGGFVCLLAVLLSPDISTRALSAENAQISTDTTVNDLAMNSAYKMLYSAAMPLIDIILPVSTESE